MSFKIPIAAFVTVTLISGMYFNLNNAKGAGFTFVQTSWTGGQTANSASHTNNQGGWNEFSEQTNVNSSTSGQVSLAQGSVDSFSETFDTTTFKDVSNTNADWNNTGNQLSNIETTNLHSKLSGMLDTTSTVNAVVRRSADTLYVATTGGKFIKYTISTGVVVDLTDKINSFWGLSNIKSLAYDGANGGVIYLGGGGKLARYNLASYIGGGIYPTANKAYDLTPKLSFWNNGDILSLVRDSANGTVYFSGANGKFAKYTIATDTVTDLTGKIASFWIANAVNSLAFDTVNSVVYLGGAGGKFAKYDVATDTITDLTSKLVGFGTTMINSLTLDTTYGSVYLFGNTSKVNKYDIALDAVIDLTSKAVAAIGSATLSTSVYDPDGGILYAGGPFGTFAQYSPDADEFTDLASSISSSWGPNAINCISYYFGDTLYLGGALSKLVKYTISDSSINDYTTDVESFLVNSTLVNSLAPYSDGAYLGSSDGKFLKYTASDGSVIDLTDRIPFWGSSSIFSLAMDATNNAVYLGGAIGKFAKYDIATDTAIDLTSQLSSLGITVNVSALALDDANGTVYLGCASGKFAKYTIASNAVSNMTSYLSALGLGSNTINSIIKSSTAIYIGAANGKFLRYNIAADTATDLAGKISSFWSTNAIRSLAYDSANNVIYLSGSGVAGSKFAKYDITNDVGANLWDRIASFAPSVLFSLEYDANRGVIYVGGNDGRLSKYTVATDTATDLTAKTISLFGNNNFRAMKWDAQNGGVYMGSDLGGFIKYDASTSAQSVSVDDTSSDIVSATLTKNDTLNAGTINYYLSNNGTDWEQVTPGAEHVFATTGSDLRFKITLSGDSTVQDVTVSYPAGGAIVAGDLVSSVYNTAFATAALSKLQWSETLPADTDIKFQLRTSADGNNWGSWCGPDDATAGSCSETSFFTDSTGNESIDDIQKDGLNDQYFQYKVFLTSLAGVEAPVLSDVSVSYDDGNSNNDGNNNGNGNGEGEGNGNVPTAPIVTPAISIKKSEGKNLKIYKKYKRIHNVAAQKSSYVQVRKIKKTNPAELERLKALYAMYKSSGGKELAKLSKKTQDDFKFYKKYRIYKQYLFLKNKAGK